MLLYVARMKTDFRSAIHPKICCNGTQTDVLIEHSYRARQVWQPSNDWTSGISLTGDITEQWDCFEGAKKRTVLVSQGRVRIYKHVLYV